ncbi:MAG: DUF5606 domain-containing protein [Sediminibacterium sp.]|jgi:hypothetical protein|nr:DUF5606 domain-containing protein [Sediminibacterium sp.]
MEYSKLIAVTGMPGLFELVSSKHDGALVKSLEDGTTKFASNRSHQFSHLESIEVYTIRENVNLVEVFQAMKSAGKNLPNEKNANEVSAYFREVFPDLDFDRVYASDMKKMVKWFKILTANDVELILNQDEEEAE